MNCCVLPAVTVGVAGVTVMDVVGPAVQLKPTAPTIVPLVAATEVGPTPRHVNTPALLTVAMPLFGVLHVTELVRLCIEPED